MGGAEQDRIKPINVIWLSTESEKIEWQSASLFRLKLVAHNL